ncbi:MAG: helix-turn-helix domain-containing protein [Dehalococcoidia bacterium]|nr:helix-turn-helix domain-containing protein [Dehalococcoidia bacterium]
MAKRGQWHWDAHSVKGLRRHLALTQDELAEELGVRQQTISEWETGSYRPRGASERVLFMVAEQAGFEWAAAAVSPPGTESRPQTAGGAASPAAPAGGDERAADEAPS